MCGSYNSRRKIRAEQKDEKVGICDEEREGERCMEIKPGSRGDVDGRRHGGGAVQKG